MNRFFRQVSAVIKQKIAREPNNGDTSNPSQPFFLFYLLL